MINMAVATYFIVLGVTIVHFDLWFTSNWWLGGACGFVIAIAWFRLKGIAIVLAIAGAALWGLILAGRAEGLPFESRSFASGVSAGMLVGWTAYLVFSWKNNAKRIKAIAEFEGNNWALKVLTSLGVK